MFCLSKATDLFFILEYCDSKDALLTYRGDPYEVKLRLSSAFFESAQNPRPRIRTGLTGTDPGEEIKSFLAPPGDEQARHLSLPETASQSRDPLSRQASYSYRPAQARCRAFPFRVYARYPSGSSWSGRV